MDVAASPTAKAPRRKWFLVGFAALALAVAVAFVYWPSRRSAMVTGAHVGGNVFTMTNHSDESLFVNVLIEVQTNGQWVARPQSGSDYKMAPHQSRTYFFNGAGGPVVPEGPWRLHGMIGRQAEGFSRRWHLLLTYLKIRRQGFRPGFNPFTATIRVDVGVGEFFAYPVSEPASNSH